MERALLNMVLGMGIVFSVLILISLVIGCFQIFPILEKRFQQRKLNKTAQDSTAVDNLETGIQEEPLLRDYTMIAIISAAIAASNNCSTNDFVVKSIKRRNEIGE